MGWPIWSGTIRRTCMTKNPLIFKAREAIAASLATAFLMLGQPVLASQGLSTEQGSDSASQVVVPPAGVSWSFVRGQPHRIDPFPLTLNRTVQRVVDAMLRQPAG